MEIHQQILNIDLKIKDGGGVSSDKSVEVVDAFGYLGADVDCQIKWKVNTEHIVQRGQLLRQLLTFFSQQINFEPFLLIIH